MSQKNLFNMPDTVRVIENKIKEQSQKYYSNGTQEFSDDEFDAMVEHLKSIEPDSAVLNTTGWGYDVDADANTCNKFPHIYGEVGSLTKCRSWDELNTNLKDVDVFLSLKLDGLSGVLYYDHGNLVRALTRGDGETGIDITDKILKIDSSLKTIRDDMFTGAVRGEIIMSNENFKRFSCKRSDAKNARNATVGIIGRNEISEDLKYIDFVVYTVIGDEGILNDDYQLSMDMITTWLSSNFKHIAPHCTCKLESNSFMDIMNRLKDLWYNKYPADGVVITNRNLIVLSEQHRIMYPAQAFKFKSEVKAATVTDVEWNMSKTGYLVPKIKIDSVQLAGTTVTYCTGFNAKYILDNGVGVGAVVEVEKHGEIIPNINKIICPAYPEIPTHCPECGNELKWEGVHVMCINPECSNAYRQDLAVWINHIAPMDGLGDAILFKHLEMLFPQELSIESVMNESSRDWKYEGSKSSHEGLVFQMLNKLYGHDGSEVRLEDALEALNIPRLGKLTAKKLAAYPKVIHDMINDLPSATTHADELTHIVGPATTASIMQNLNKFSRLKFIQDRINWKSNSRDNECKVRVAITGKLSCKRSDFEKELRDAGFEPKDISRDTKFLITDDPNSLSSKNKKADEWGIKKLTENEFRSIYLNKLS